MRLGDVDHEEVGYVAEVLDELLELLKLVDKRGSAATSKTQHQRPVACKYTRSAKLKSTEGHAEATTLESGHRPFIYALMLVFSPSMLNTGEAGASPPTKDSCPRLNHRLCAKVLVDFTVAKVKPQSSYLKLGFCVMVAFSPILRIIFLARLGEAKRKIHIVTVSPIIKQMRHTVDKYTITFCQNMLAPWRPTPVFTASVAV